MPVCRQRESRMDAEQVVRTFVDAWNALDWERIYALMAPDIVYHNMPLRPVVGIEAVRAGFAAVAQGKQVPNPVVGAYVPRRCTPGEHSMHTVLPAWLATYPAAQSSQMAAPLKLVFFPTAQSKQKLLCVLGIHWPGLHSSHSVE